VTIEAILWPLGIGIWLAVLVLMVAVALFIAAIVIALPFVAVSGFRRGVRRYHEEVAARRAAEFQSRLTSDPSRTRSE
jgi:uncharacterized membrane protein YccF (DUF307 family)